MIIINISSWPQQSTLECVKCFLELPPFPEYITERGPYTRFVKGVGIESIHVLEFDESKYAEASEFIGKRILAFSVVPGFSCSSQPWAEAQETVKWFE